MKGKAKRISYGDEARIIYKRLCLSCLILLNVTITERRNGLRSHNPNLMHLEYFHHSSVPPLYGALAKKNNWISGQARNDKLHMTYIIRYKNKEREAEYENNFDLFVCSAHCYPSLRS